MTTHNLPTVALSIRQPWAWLILNAGKDIENRNWRTGFRGRVLIHAAKAMTRADYAACCLFCNGLDDIEPIMNFPGFKSTELHRGGIVGEVEIVDCVSKSDSPWFCGDYGFVLKHPAARAFEPCKGALGFFTPKQYL